MPLILTIGSSEIALFRKEKQFLRRKYGIYTRVDFCSDRHISECIHRVELLMTPDVDCVLIWALTTMAWKPKELINQNSKKSKIFEPASEFDVEEVPSIMTKISEIVKKLNPRTKVYLLISPIQDMYSFNKNQLICDWGSSFSDYFIEDPILAPNKMREHSIASFNKFESLASSHYDWPNKNILRGNEILNFHYRATCYSKADLPSPHSQYFNGKQLTLKSPLLPDGLHPNRMFLEALVEKYYRSFGMYKPQVRTTQNISSRVAPREGTGQRPRPLVFNNIPNKSNQDISQPSTSSYYPSFSNRLEGPPEPQTSITSKSSQAYNYSGNDYFDHASHSQTNSVPLPQSSYGQSYYPSQFDNQYSVSYSNAPSTSFTSYSGPPDLNTSSQPKQGMSLDRRIKLILRQSIRDTMNQINWKGLTKENRKLVSQQWREILNEEEELSEIMPSINQVLGKFNTM